MTGAATIGGGTQEASAATTRTIIGEAKYQRGTGNLG